LFESQLPQEGYPSLAEFLQQVHEFERLNELRDALEALPPVVAHVTVCALALTMCQKIMRWLTRKKLMKVLLVGAAAMKQNRCLSCC
jgi:hypothetical protein